MELVGAGLGAGDDHRSAGPAEFRAGIVGEHLELLQAVDRGPDDERLGDHFGVVDAIDEELIAAVAGTICLQRGAAGTQFIRPCASVDGAGLCVGETGDARSEDGKLREVAAV